MLAAIWVILYRLRKTSTGLIFCSAIQDICTTQNTNQHIILSSTWDHSGGSNYRCNSMFCMVFSWNCTQIKHSKYDVTYYWAYNSLEASNLNNSFCRGHLLIMFYGMMMVIQSVGQKPFVYTLEKLARTWSILLILRPMNIGAFDQK